MSATVVTYAGVLAILLSAIGLYGSLALSVARRTREIGIRLAMGGSPGEILGLIAGEGMKVILLAVVTGIALAMGSAQLLQHLFYGSASVNIWSYALAAVIVTLVGLVSCWLPARHASKIPPTQALRQA